MRVLAAFVGGLAIWFASVQLDAVNPSLNGIVYGVLIVILITLSEILEEIKGRKK